MAEISFSAGDGCTLFATVLAYCIGVAVGLVSA
jgi:hypothetical protein